jgi:hypothetical protein
MPSRVARGAVAGLLLLGVLACTRRTALDDYYPLEKGRRWTYDVTTEPVEEGDEPVALVVTSLGQEDLAGRRVSREKIDVAGETHYLFVAADEKGFYRYATQSAGEKSPAIEDQRDDFLAAPLEVGRSWRGKSAPTFLDVADVAVDIVSTVVSTSATIRVPAGEFTGCLEIGVAGKARIEPSQDDDGDDGAATAAAVEQPGDDAGPDGGDDQDDELPDEAEDGGTFTLAEHTWYAPGVGVVKSVVEESFAGDSGEADQARVTTALRSFKR